MDNEQIIKQFDEIERKIERVIEVYKSCEAKNLELTNKIDKLEEELRSKADVEQRYQEEKTLIRSKIDNLLARLGDLTDQ